MAHTVCHKDEAYFRGMAQEVSDFLKGQDDKIIDELKLKMNTAAQNMEFEAGGRISGSDPGYRDPADQTAGHGQGFAEPGCLWLLRGQGLDVCAGLLCPSGQADRARCQSLPLLQ